MDVDFSAPNIDGVGFYRLDGRKPHGSSGAHVELGAVV
jgi:hypothetical protein